MLIMIQFLFDLILIIALFLTIGIVSATKGGGAKNTAVSEKNYCFLNKCNSNRAKSPSEVLKRCKAGEFRGKTKSALK